MTETITRSPELEQPAGVAQRLADFDQQINAWSVPDIATLANAALLEKEVHQIGEHEYADAHGSQLDASLVERVKVKTSPDTWMIGIDDIDDAEHARDAASPEDLNEKNYADFQIFAEGSGAKDEPSAFAAYKKYVNARINLSETLFDMMEEPRGAISLEVRKPDSARPVKANESVVNVPRVSDLDDLVKVDRRGKGHRPDGKFLSSYELEQIAANQEQIREGVADRAAGLKYRQQKKDLMLGMYGPDVYAERFAHNPNVDPDAWKAQTETTTAGQYHGKHRIEDQLLRPDDMSDTDWNSLSDEEKQNLHDYLRAEQAAKTVESVPTDEDESFWNALPAEAKVMWNSLSDEEKQNLRDYVAAESAAESERVTEPVTDASPKGLKARWNRLVGKAWATLQTMKPQHGAHEYTTAEERAKRRKIITGVAAAAAVIGAGVAIYLETRGHSAPHSGGNKPAVHPQAAKTPVSHPHVATKPYQEVTLKPGTGDSLWREETLHHPSATQHQIWERVQRDMAMNHIHSEAEAEHMSGVVKITK